jgi:hypothetical protein
MTFRLLTSDMQCRLLRHLNEYTVANLCFNELRYSVDFTLNIDSIYWRCKLLIMHA